MIELNLLPQELKRKKRTLELPEIPIIPIAACIIGALVFVQLFLGGLILMSKAQLTGLEKTWQSLAPEKAELDNIKKELASRARMTEAIDGLIEEQPNWARLLNEMSNSLTPNIWLTELECGEETEKHPRRAAKLPERRAVAKGSKKPGPAGPDGLVEPKGGILIISGFAAGRGEETTANVARFIRSLKENEGFFRDFADVELVSMKKSVVEKQDVMNFTLACKYRPRGKGE